LRIKKPTSAANGDPWEPNPIALLKLPDREVILEKAGKTLNEGKLS
jgi:hypothetical protein